MACPPLACRWPADSTLQIRCLAARRQLRLYTCSESRVGGHSRELSILRSLLRGGHTMCCRSRPYGRKFEHFGGVKSRKERSALPQSESPAGQTEATWLPQCNHLCHPK